MRLIICTLTAVLMTLHAVACATQKGGSNAAQTSAAQSGSGAQQATNQSASASVNWPSRQRFFRGVIGDFPIQMKLQREGQTLSGTYSYVGKGQDLTLKGQIDSQNKLTLQEFDASGKQTGKFEGELTEKVNEEDVDENMPYITGKWSLPDGSKEMKFAVNEERIEFTNGLRFVPKVITERRLGITATYPQLAGSNAQAVTNFNRKVAAMVEKAVADFKEGLSPQKENYYSTNYNVLLATNELVSIEINEESYAGGAYPNSDSSALTYDLRADRELQLDDLFKPGSDYKQAIRQYSVNSINKLMKEAESEEKKQGAQDERGFSSEELPELSGWAMTRKGVVAYYPLPHVIAAYSQVFIPYSALKDFIKPDGPAATFVEEKR